MTAERVQRELAEALVEPVGQQMPRGHVWRPDRIAAALLPVVQRLIAEGQAEALGDFADLVDRGPTFPLPPSIFSAMARERADDLDPSGGASC